MSENSKRVSKAIDKKVREGGRRLPPYVLDATEKEALAHLEKHGYAPNTKQCLSRAIIEAAERAGWKPTDPPPEAAGVMKPLKNQSSITRKKGPSK
jgi:hypothetical protein